MIDLSGVSLQFNGKYLFQNINYKINSGDKISLVGANGTGKSSLLKIINGNLQPESGKILKQKGISIGYLPQEMIVHQGKTLLEEAKSSLTDIIILQEKETFITNQLADESINEEERDDLIHQLGNVHLRLEELDSYSATSKVQKILIGLGFEEDEFEKLTNEFSGGWQMRIELAKILITQNDLLLMDEPTNHLDLDSLEWLTGFLKNYKGALLTVSHDKNFINRVTSKTLEIFMGKFYTFSGDYDAYLKFKDERDLQLANQFILQQKKIKETEKFIERFRYKATKSKQVQSRIKQLDKIELIELPESKENISISFPEPPSSGKMNIELKSITKSFGEKIIFSGLDFQVNRGDKIAFVGPNGAGKTTLAKIISGKINFEKGERIIGHNTIISYYAQDVADNLNPDFDIIETVDGIAEDKTIGQLRTLLGSFLFTGDDVFKKVGVLSGGEKSRVALSKILLTKANFIILDEPTNHLDISSKQVLQKALLDFSGSLILVSHDVDFLIPIVNKVVEIRKGEVKLFEGGIEYYLSKKQQLQNADLELPGNKNASTDVVSKKDQKRIDAEQRQKRYAATKHLIKKVTELENQIELLEKKEKKLEHDLTLPEIFSNPQKARETTFEFGETKKKLLEKIKDWEKISEELQEIEKQFS
ncbi:MAG TPA: ABC-F family ATP-binding cassette domain-containing protein [Ignavibacteriaceae bacterium]|nr:ABC-F family ATP-binding cassette domain-containing protein [Ignavibacteriaceae bacterium]